MLHLLAGGPGSDARHITSLLAEALRTSGVARPRVACVGAANGDHPGFFRRMAELFKAAGAGAFDLAPTVPATDRARTVLARADAIFMSGGDVAAGVEALRKAGLVPLLAERHAAGVPFVGLSAGSIMLGRQWIAWADPDDDTTAAPFDCLGFAPLLCDTHAEEDDWAELRALLELQPPGTRGYGITSRAMLRVHPDGRTEAVGGEVVCLTQTVLHPPPRDA
jgi:peptidase E